MTASIVAHESREKINAHFYVPRGRDADLHIYTTNHGQLWERVAESVPESTPKVEEAVRYVKSHRLMRSTGLFSETWAERGSTVRNVERYSRGVCSARSGIIRGGFLVRAE